MSIFSGVEMFVFLCVFVCEHKNVFILACGSLCSGLCFVVFRLCFEQPKSVFCVSKTLSTNLGLRKCLQHDNGATFPVVLPLDMMNLGHASIPLSLRNLSCKGRELQYAGSSR